MFRGGATFRGVNVIMRGFGVCRLEILGVEIVSGICVMFRVIVRGVRYETAAAFLGSKREVGSSRVDLILCTRIDFVLCVLFIK